MKEVSFESEKRLKGMGGKFFKKTGGPPRANLVSRNGKKHLGTKRRRVGVAHMEIAYSVAKHQSRTRFHGKGNAVLCVKP